ncbi:hypothetical protein [Xenorhabdus bovienii]|uniref:hypothetical protein n=1 Tax=Xenorhabdus bovienii TaxID=40576 RepID=UPI0023B2AB20|nr:hypothetical protein [Xenorhabdus bovienii]MDE9428666.1 hypothetical protein [Xenorhabdus bovienii]
MISFIIRNNPLIHPVLVALTTAIKRINNEQDIKIRNLNAWFLDFYISHDNYKNANWIIVDDPITFLYCVYKLKISHKKIIFYSLEMYEYQLSNDTLKNRTRNLIFLFAHRHTQKKAFKIIFPSQKRLDFYLNNKAQSYIKNKSVVIYNYPESNSLSIDIPDEKYINLIKMLKSNNKKIIIYAGSIQKGRNLEKIASQLATSENHHLILIGHNKNCSTEYFNAMRNVSFLGQLPRKQVNYFYDQADIGLLQYENEPLNTKLCAPVKLWEYLYFKLNIISNSNYAMQTEWKMYVDDFYETEEDLMKILSVSEYKNQHLQDIPFLEEEIVSFIRENLIPLKS